MSFKGFDRREITVGRARYLAAVGGSGSPVVLLLHGFPETHVCWEQVATGLAPHATVVAPDLRGYGGSRAPAGGPLGQGYSKREMAAELVEVMAELGHHRFAVVGHDRGARVAYRMALDHPESVVRTAVLNIIPTVDQFEAMSGGPALGYWPWFFLAQPAPFPEQVLQRASSAFLDHVFATWPATKGSISRAHRDAYEQAMTTDAIAAMCADYRASFHLDQQHDDADRQAGRRIRTPVLVLTGEEESQLADAMTIWSRWTDDVQAARVPGGHFLPEEAPDQVLDQLKPFLLR
jgi:haloacetate dehalogenase